MRGIFDDGDTPGQSERTVDRGLEHMGGTDPGVAQELTVGAHGRMSLLDPDPRAPLTGLHGHYVDRFTGDSRSPQEIDGANWDPELHRDPPPVQTSTPYLPGRPSPAGATGEVGEDQDGD